jgi:invasion protein IalB
MCLHDVTAVGRAGAHLSEVLMSDAWFYDAGKYRQVGPLTLRELQDRLAAISNPTDVLVWRGGFRDWKLAKDVPELAAQIVVAPSLPRESTTASAKHPHAASGDDAFRKEHRTLFVVGAIVAVVAIVAAGSFVILREKADDSVRSESMKAARPAPTAPPVTAQSAPAPGPQGAPPSPAPQRFIYSPWAKLCSKGQDAQAKQVCITRRDARTEAGQLVMAAALIESEGGPKKLLRVTVPNQLQLQSGTRVVVDQLPPVSGPFFACFADGCMADYEATPDLIGKLKHGQMLTIQAINLAGAMMNFPMPLVDFTKVNEGPPTDPKVFEEQQMKLQDEIQKRSKPEGQAGAFSGSLRPTLPIR